MELPWNDPQSNKFATTVGLITSDGTNGPNIMACEWTHHISYNPGLVAICLGHTKATVQNIRNSKEFGISLCSKDQSIISSIAGGYSGSEYNKIDAIREMGFEFVKANKIKPFMVKDAALNIECILHKEIILGDHIMFVGEVIEASYDSERYPLVYHDGKYWSLESIIKPKKEEREMMKKILEKHKIKASQ